MSELKPCPFDGSKPSMTMHEVAYHPMYRVNCTTCAASTSLHDTEERATAIWNTRAPDRGLIRYALQQSGWPVKLPSREDFESAWKRLNDAGRVYVIGRNPDGTYLSEETEFNWQLWQAALASIPQPPFTDLDAAVETIASGWEASE